MRVINLSEVLGKGAARDSVVDAIRSGKVIVYPTDTIYGIGCDASNSDAVERIRKAKCRDGKVHFSVIAPGKGWIWKNTRMTGANRDLADKLLPGPYTIIAQAAPSSPRPVVSSENAIGVRFPRHPFTDVVVESGAPLVTTSVNLHGGKPAASLDDVPPPIKGIVDLAVDAGRIEGQASRIFDFRTEDVKTITRR